MRYAHVPNCETVTLKCKSHRITKLSFWVPLNSGNNAFINRSWSLKVEIYTPASMYKYSIKIHGWNPVNYRYVVSLQFYTHYVTLNGIGAPLISLICRVLCTTFSVDFINEPHIWSAKCGQFMTLKIVTVKWFTGKEWVMNHVSCKMSYKNDK